MVKLASVAVNLYHTSSSAVPYSDCAANVWVAPILVPVVVVVQVVPEFIVKVIENNENRFLIRNGVKMDIKNYLLERQTNK